MGKKNFYFKESDYILDHLGIDPNGLYGRIIEFYGDYIKIKWDYDSIDSLQKLTSLIKNLSNNQLLKFIKKMTIFDFFDTLDGDRYKSMHFKIKYVFRNGKVYCYNELAHTENRKYLEVKKINGIDIQVIIDKLNSECFNEEQIEKLLLYKEIVQALGFSDGYSVTFADNDDETIVIDFEKEDIDYSAFWKKHDRAQLLDNMVSESLDDGKQEVVFSDARNRYAYDSSIRLLSLLQSFCKSSDDIQLLDEVKSNYLDIGTVNVTDDRYMDWMYISSFFLMNKVENATLPSQVYDEMKLLLQSDANCMLLDANNNNFTSINDINVNGVGVNTLVLDQNNNFNYVNFFVRVRNALAHSEYEVLDNDYVRLYGYGNDKRLDFNVKLKKDVVLSFMDCVYQYYNFSGTFPVAVYEKSVDYFSKSMSSFDDVRNALKKAIIGDVKAEMKDFNIQAYPFHKVIIHDGGLDQKRFMFKNHSITDYFDRMISPDHDSVEEYVREQLDGVCNYKYTDITLSSDQIDSIISQIKLFYQDAFFKNSPENQRYVLSELVKNEINPNRNISNYIYELLRSNNKLSGGMVNTLDETPTGYINYSKVIKSTIIAYLNNILLYSYNYNYRHNLDCSELDFSSMSVPQQFSMETWLIKYDEEFKAKRENEFKTWKSWSTAKNKSALISYLESAKKNLEEVRNNKTISEEEKKKRERIWEDKIKSLEESIDKNNAKNKEYYDRITNIEMKLQNPNFNMVILEHLRNTLAHGNVFFSNIDINDIGSLELTFKDYDGDSLEFEGTIKFSDLLRILDNKKFINSLYGIVKPLDEKKLS